MNLGDTWGITPPHYLLTTASMYIRQCLWCRIWWTSRASSRAFSSVSFTFMIKEKTKMDKACNDAKIKVALWWYDDGDRSHLCIMKEKVWALNMLDYVCSSCWRGAPRLFALNVYVVPSSIHFSSASALFWSRATDLLARLCSRGHNRVASILVIRHSIPHSMAVKREA